MTMTSAERVLLHHVGVVATNPAAAAAFYERLLGGASSPMAGHTVVTAGDVRIAVVARHETDPQGPGRGSHIAFSLPIDGRPGLLVRLGELGVGHEEVKGRIYTRDPDGLTLEFLFE